MNRNQKSNQAIDLFSVNDCSLLYMVVKGETSFLNSKFGMSKLMPPWYILLCVQSCLWLYVVFISSFASIFTDYCYYQHTIYCKSELLVPHITFYGYRDKDLDMLMFAFVCALCDCGVVIF